MSRAFHHVGLTVSNMETALDFYALLGFEKRDPQNLEILDQEWLPGIVQLSPANMKVSFVGMGPLNIELIEYLDPKGGAATPLDVNDAGSAHFGLEVADVGAEYERLAAAGVRFRGEPVTIPADVPAFGGVTAVYGYDPDGNCFEMQNFPTTSFD